MPQVEQRGPERALRIDDAIDDEVAQRRERRPESGALRSQLVRAEHLEEPRPHRPRVLGDRTKRHDRRRVVSDRTESRRFARGMLHRLLLGSRDLADQLVEHAALARRVVHGRTSRAATMPRIGDGKTR
ncbi:MAG TPA: hypothetical protein VFQ53_12815 [Kofleriaceae bacterium]|nr:hypothetical protein [Kofleriaceae bacterium]